MSTDVSPIDVLPWPAIIGELRSYAVFAMTPDGEIASWNAGVRELLGYEADEWIGRPGAIVFTEQDLAHDAAVRELALATREGRAQDDRWHVRADGRLVWVNGAVNSLHDDEGRLVGFLKVMRDQTAARAVETRLRESEERFAKAFRANPTPIALLTLPDARIVDVNDAFLETFGHAREEVENRGLVDVGIEPDVADLRRIRAAFRVPEPARLEAPFRRADGERGRGTFAFEPVEFGGEPHLVMLMHDVTVLLRYQRELERQRAYVDAILDALPGIFYLFGESGYVRWNEEFERVTGYAPEEIERLRPPDVVVESAEVLARIDEAYREGRTTMEGHLRTKDGREIPYLFTGRRVELSGRPHVAGVGLDVSRQARDRVVLERQALEQRAFAALSASSLASDDLARTFDLAAHHVAQALGVEHVHVYEHGEGARFVLRASVRDGARASEEALGATVEHDPGAAPADDAADAEPERSPPEVLARFGMASGLRMPIRGHDRLYGVVEVFSSREDAFGDGDARFLRSVALLLAGAIEHQRLHAELEHRAEHDELTGLPTRAAFEGRLREALGRARRAGTHVAVLFVDLDRFKNINDSLGHQAGDEVLQNVARRIRDAVRSWDTVARLGGDEFVLFLPDVQDAAEVAHVGERLLAAFEEPVAAAGRELVVRATIGVALFPDDGESVADLLRAADAAMYEGKGRGRSAFHFFAPEQDDRVAERLRLENELRRALDRDEFDVSFQPRIDLENGRVTAVEALLRWRHPSRGRLAPADFMEIADALGATVALDEFAMREAFARHAAWREATGSPLRIAVNVAREHFLQPSFPDTVRRLVGEAGFGPEEVELEITEAALLGDAEVVAAHLAALRELGVALVIDDFGTGASSLQRLAASPIDRVKVDEAFVHRIEEPRGRDVIAAIVGLALSLGADAVAEGIESEAQARLAREAGFAEAQGRHVLPPGAADEVRAFLDGRRGRGSGA